ncbi:MAG: hypothetical protein UU22_C0044G0006 [Parcubacteria group bacterium GW2011_GWA2_40_8]|nr:MAG: hypothetical protein UU22_C0044G0006 [Parcubacteria group bacterium GW2011_GWA2_40_8]
MKPSTKAKLSTGLRSLRSLDSKSRIEAIAVLGIVAGTIGGIFYANQRGSITGRQQTIEASLVQEALEAVKSIVNSNDATSQGWNRIYCPPDAVEPGEGGTCSAAGAKGAPDSNPYKVKVVGSVWKLYQGAETITIGTETYIRAVHIENVSRDSSGQIESSYNASNDDPFTVWRNKLYAGCYFVWNRILFK